MITPEAKREKTREANRRYYESHREKVKQRQRERYAENPEARFTQRRSLSRMLSVAKHRAKNKQLEFSIEPSDLTIPELCPVLQIPIILKQVLNSHGPTDNAPSLDRIDNSKGYIKGNVRVISHRANYLKRDMTKEEARLLYENFDSCP